jgi:hypothetical protein
MFFYVNFRLRKVGISTFSRSDAVVTSSDRFDSEVPTFRSPPDRFLCKKASGSFWAPRGPAVTHTAFDRGRLSGAYEFYRNFGFQKMREVGSESVSFSRALLHGIT